jgi:hypothetical protein
MSEFLEVNILDNSRKESNRPQLPETAQLLTFLLSLILSHPNVLIFVTA